MGSTVKTQLKDTSKTKRRKTLLFIPLKKHTLIILFIWVYFWKYWVHTGTICPLSVHTSLLPSTIPKLPWEKTPWVTKFNNKKVRFPAHYCDFVSHFMKHSNSLLLFYYYFQQSLQILPTCLKVKTQPLFAIQEY